MKKIFTLILTCFLSLSLSGCSSSKNNEDILTFFNALDNTLNLKSAQISGTLDMKDSKLNIDAQILQKEDLQIASTIGLVAGGNVQNNFLNFYIKDGKTYLNSMGTKTQSTVDKIGLKTNSKLNTYNPFLDLTDDQLCELFDSSKKENDTYTFKVNTSKLATLLDNMGSIKLDNATLEATIKNKNISHLVLSFTGKQTVDDASANIDVSVELSIKKLNKINFPNDLDSYTKETAEN
ncbi:hypothetical protein [uncultured Holdemanella sp.]|uniref:hypothetical protein n=1 Tax=uncultured Holdemanella sp. TaxID=1763549 RepID=UPI002804F21C|nr:hypothetical protein [uncultured Holdemanella sp.]